jgi:hypothetical protein
VETIGTGTRAQDSCGPWHPVLHERTSCTSIAAALPPCLETVYGELVIGFGVGRQVAGFWGRKSRKADNAGLRAGCLSSCALLKRVAVHLR